MNTFIISLAIMISEVVFHNAEPRFSVIYHPIHVERLYLRVLDRELHIEPNLSMRIEVKNRICNDIMGSEFFDMNEYYTASSFTFSKPTKPIKVAVEGKIVKEYAFTCEAISRLTKKITEYYVSDSYNVNEASNWLKNRIAGHFIFRYIRKDNIWVIHSFAEEAASVLGSSRKTFTDPGFLIHPAPQDNVENMYLDVLETRNEADDSVCKLSNFNKIRLCSSVLKSSFFEDQVMFKPSAKYMGSECVRGRVYLLTDKAKNVLREKRKGGKYVRTYENMLLCIGRLKPPALIFKEFYVSHGYAPNQVFVFHDNEFRREFILLNLSTKVNVVVE